MLNICSRKTYINSDTLWNQFRSLEKVRVLTRMTVKNYFLVFSEERYPFSVVPVLEVDGKVLTESLAIARYLAAEFGKFLWRF